VIGYNEPHGRLFMDRHGAINLKIVTGVAVPILVALIGLIPPLIKRANDEKPDKKSTSAKSTPETRAPEKKASPPGGNAPTERSASELIAESITSLIDQVSVGARCAKRSSSKRLSL
jgi:hypothetical protein